MKRSKSDIIGLIILTVWVITSSVSVLCNLLNIPREYRVWGGLSDRQKRQKIFGSVYDFAIFIKDNTKGEDVLLFSKNDMAYFLSRYYLYPQNIYWNQDEKKLLDLAKSMKFRYVVSYDDRLKIKGYQKINSFSSQKSKDYGYLYMKR